MDSQKTNVADVDDKRPSIVKLVPEAVEEARRRLISAGIHEKKLLSTDQGLRLGVKGGGCSGLSYVIEIDTRKKEDYVSVENGFMVLVDPKSSLYLQGVELHYSGGFVGSGFKFVNPSATATCGCGESFSL